MDTIVTLNIDHTVVENAEIYARYFKKNVSQLVEEYLLSISSETNIIHNKPLGPITSRLAGIIKLDNNTDHKEAVTNALMEKYL
jgi:hypothetical protein